ncbi:MAG: hypothetical protein IJO63_02620 [Bacilli bacterium]|nr:hypothetical protein [Bacilli bacterium]
MSIAIPYQKGNYNSNNVLVDEGNNEQTEIEELSFEDLKTSLLKYNFDYTYTVNTSEGKVIYKGTMLGNETIGYKESAQGIERYIVRGVKIYKNQLGEITEQYDKTVNVYNGYLSVDKIMELLEGKDYIQSDNQYDFQIDNVYVKILVSEYNISSIEIIEGDNSYLLQFDNVNEIKEL